MMPLYITVAVGLGMISCVSGVTIPKTKQLDGRAANSIWQPQVQEKWQIVLNDPITLTNGKPATDADIYDIDLFENTNQGTDNTTLAALHSLGKRVICYFNAGAYQPDQPDDSRFQASDMGAVMEGWDEEKWLNLKSDNVRSIMADRIALAAKLGCDAVDPDNTDAWTNDNGLGLTQQDSVDFVKVLIAAANKNNIAIGLKNTADILGDVIGDIQFAVNEQCAQYEECADYQPLIAAGKPVFHIEYTDVDGGVVLNGSSTTSSGTASTTRSGSSDASDGDEDEDSDGNDDNDKKKLLKRSLTKAQACTMADVDITKFSTVIKTLDLDEWVDYCS